MRNSLNIASELIDFLKKYEEEKGYEPKDIKEFAFWLNHLVFEQFHKVDNYHNKSDIDTELTFLLIMQNKHFKMYCKDVLADSEINTPDEYSFLYHMCMVDSFRKMELIHIHLLEAPSGIEVIKRLLKKGLIEEFDDVNDRRAKRVKITDKGRKETDKLIPKMREVYTKMAANLTTNEKIHVISFLKELNDYHITNNRK